MKPKLLIAITYLLPVCLQAQITLNSSNAPSIAQCQIQDTFEAVKMGGLPDLSVKTNATWDLTTTVDSYSYYTFNKAASSTAFPTATFSISGMYDFSALSYNSENMFDVTSTGIVCYGEHLDRQALPIGALTGDSGDSLIFVQQDIMYSPAENEMKYPCTMNTTWTDVNKFTTAFNLTVAAYTLNNAPGERRSERTTTYTVKGWGKMRVNDENGNPTGYMDVLQVESGVTIVDTFYLNGSLAPTPLLTAFGLTQGQSLSDYHRYFFRAGEYRPLLAVLYTDNTYATVENSGTHRQRLAPTGINDIPSQNISVYPNPVNDGSFTVKVGVPYDKLSYELYNMAGQMVQKGALPQSGVVTLNANQPTGNYMLQLHTDAGANGVKQISIVK